jgi:hypothetical protein
VSPSPLSVTVPPAAVSDFDLAPPVMVANSNPVPACRALVSFVTRTERQREVAVAETTPASIAEGGTFRMELTAPELKVTYAALRSLLDDFGHDERDTRDIVKAVLAKLPSDDEISRIDLGTSRR